MGCLIHSLNTYHECLLYKGIDLANEITRLTKTDKENFLRLSHWGDGHLTDEQTYE